MEVLKKYLLIFFSAAILFPVVVNLVHIFGHQEEVICSNFTDAHYHKKSFDCKLCDLRTTGLVLFEPCNYNLYIPQSTPTITSSNYNFLSDYQSLAFENRGPPLFPAATVIFG
ncbi:hypothetical protein BH23BAC2_BH23BAC2_08300 [soil metagenome]